MTFTLSQMARDVSVASVKRQNTTLININAIKVVDGFNVRDQDEEVRAHIESILGSITAGLPIPPIEVWVNPDNGDLELVDGHCRYTAFTLHSMNDKSFDGFVSAVSFEGTPAERKARIASSNNQLKLKPVELGRVYMALRDEEGLGRQEIAKMVGRSLAHVDQMLILASAGNEVIEAVERNEISSSEAVKLARDFKEGAPAELERRKEIAKESGKSKVMPKLAPRKASANPSFVLQAAGALVDSIGPATSDLIVDGSFTTISVDALLLADLITTIRELREAAKPLDADKQQELAV